MKVYSLGHGARRAASSERLNAETPDLMANQGGHGYTTDAVRLRMGYKARLSERIISTTAHQFPPTTCLKKALSVYSILYRPRQQSGFSQTQISDGIRYDIKSLVRLGRKGIQDAGKRILQPICKKCFTSNL